MASGDASPAVRPQDDSGFSTPSHDLSNLSAARVLATNGDDEATAPKVTICVFCGSSDGTSPAHAEAARSLAHALHRHNISLVYGGGTVGLMGEIARTLVSLSGPTSVHGIIPSPLVTYERGPSSTTAATSLPSYSIYGKTTVVKDMHTRKKMMAEEVQKGLKGSGFVALGGGYGTLEELMEMVTWNQLGIHDRGVVAFNVEGYWDGLLKWVEGSVEAGFVREESRGILQQAKSGEECVERLRDYVNVEGRFKLDWEGS